MTAIGDLVTGRTAGRSGPDAITLFDSTGLAVQDLAIAAAVLEAWHGGTVPAPAIGL